MLDSLFIRCTPTLAMVFVALGSTPAAAQDYEQAAEAAIEYQRFPWQDDGELIPLNRHEPGRAESANRNTVPQRVSRNTNLPNYSIPASWFTFFNSLVWVIIAAVVVIVAVVLIYMYLRMDKTPTGASEFDDDGQEETIAERIRQLPFELQRNQPGNLSEQARQLAEQGNYSQAMMFLFSHVLVALDKHELIRLKRGKTNRQYLNELRHFRNISAYYQKVMIPFEDAFFGNYDISQTRFESCWNELNEFETDVVNAQQVATP